MKSTASLPAAPGISANQSPECGQDAAAPAQPPALPQHPCGSRTYDPDEVFTDPGTIVMIGI
ncbi:MAG: hypothetical protein HQK81_02595 [Desulfovibrionaceae bacterium]|nr:hypothetical protein [Desulfovibrionaceae bacterium]MBF0512934.1 hypothetical protein [Desulfovibrionaceae bacterium]